MSSTVTAKVVVHVSESKKSVRIDFDTTELIASLTIWFPMVKENKPGLCDAEILDRETAETVFYDHVEFTSQENLQPSITQFLKKLHDQSKKKREEFTEWSWSDDFALPDLQPKSVSPQDMLDKLMTVASCG